MYNWKIISTGSGNDLALNKLQTTNWTRDGQDWCCLTHWGRVTHICVGKPTIIGWDNGLSPDRRQAIIWTNAEILLIGPLGTNFSEILTGIQTFSFKKMQFKMSSAKRGPFCLGLNASLGVHVMMLTDISYTFAAIFLCLKFSLKTWT